MGIRLGKAVEGRDEKGIKKTVCALLKILHPDGPPAEGEFEEYVAYAVECRRRVKEQMNKRKPDDEFANIDLSYLNAEGREIVVYCPESKTAGATQRPLRKRLATEPAIEVDAEALIAPEAARSEAVVQPAASELASVPDEPADRQGIPPELAKPEEQHYTILYGDTGHSYESILAPYLKDAREIVVEDPYIRLAHQTQNFVRFCEAVLKHSTVKRIKLITSYDESTSLDEVNERLGELRQSLLEMDVVLEVELNPNLHDREIRIDNGWLIKIGRGLDFYQKPAGWFVVGANDMSLRPCLETKVDIYRQ